MPRTRRLRILCVHGVGRHPVGGSWEEEWGAEVRAALRQVDPALECELGFLHYDDLFETYELTFLGTLEALAKLAASGISAPFRARGGVRGASSGLRWTAGMVVKWVEDSRFRRETRARAAARLQRFSEADPHPPDVVLAHSLGSLVVYDTLTATPELELPDTSLVTFGSQIGNPFVSGQFLAGRIEPLEGVERWYNLYNPEDDVFTASIRLEHARFREVRTEFDLPGIADHSAPSYLGHPAAAAQVWSDVALAEEAPRLLRARQPPGILARTRAPRRRALLVGINEYPDEADRLEGCVNDVFLMSSLLQEGGYEAEDIRVVLDRRATAKGIRERLEWLLEGIGQGDKNKKEPVERIFYYSGHGAQLPTYGLGDRVDQMDETLVPYDFDWSSERAITDDELCQLYTNLPYDLRFLVMFDCCHSGGMTRDGGPRVRGLDPPDDIRHRALRWDVDVGMWKERELEVINREFLRRVKKGSKKRTARMTKRIGHAMELRRLKRGEFVRRRKQLGHEGPYMPLLLYACREEEVALEYRHGSVSYGAFTFALAKQVRSLRKEIEGGPRKKPKPPTFEGLVRLVQSDLSELGYEQHPALAGPGVKRRDLVPLFPPPRPRGAGRRKG